MLRHVSIIRSSPGSCLFLAKITLLKTGKTQQLQEHQAEITKDKCSSMV